MFKAQKTLLAGVALLILSGTLNASVPEKMNLHDSWRFKQVRLTNWYPATVPGVVHLDLIENGIIEDPYFRLNERGVQWVDKEDWLYETVFDVPERIFKKNNIRIEFAGLDTYADVYLNDQKIISANNMHRIWSADVKDHLRADSNLLKVYFHSPVKIDLPKHDSLPFRYETDNDQAANGGLLNKRLLPFARKAGYHYGWDWGPRLMTSGIWRPVQLEGWDGARICDVQYLQKNVSSKSANITVVFELEADRDIRGAELALADKSSGRTLQSKKADLKRGSNRIELDVVMKNPKLWWTNGLGEAHLYTFEASVSEGKEKLDSKEELIGIRSLELVRERDEFGRSMYFVLNGVPVFMKGVNYIPQDNFLPRVKRQRYESTVGDAAAVNMNMIRIWGGGIYEDDYFYELCDRHGILVWQDFMYSCAIYPAEGEMLENMRQEAVDNVRRLRNHPSIAVWCGGNENQDAWLGWGWRRRLENQNPEWAELVWRQFQDQYYVMLPEVVAEYGSGAAYTPNSPFSDYGVRSNDHEGDRHFWEVWHGRKPIATYNQERSRFFSEYGFQSFPNLGTVLKYAPYEKDWDIRSEVMMWHQRGGAHANNLIETYLTNEYYRPKDFSSFLYMSQLLQGDAIRTAIEAHRRDKGYCMGTLYWQLNDCWPVASWSSRDWYGCWKALHYFVRTAYQDILVSTVLEEEQIRVSIVSDRLEDISGQLTISTVSLDQNDRSTVSNQRVSIDANSVAQVAEFTLRDLFAEKDPADHVIITSFEVAGHSYSNTFYPLLHKYMNYPEATLSTHIENTESGYKVTVSTDKFARGVYLFLNNNINNFSDNFFDLLPEESRAVFIDSELSRDEFEKNLKVISLSDAH